MASPSRTLRRSSSAVLLAAAVAVPVLAAAPADAKGGSPAVQSSGTCAGGGVWKLKAKHDGGRIEIEFQVDTNRAGQAWRVAITRQQRVRLQRHPDHHCTERVVHRAAASGRPLPALTSSAPRPPSPVAPAPGR